MDLQGQVDAFGAAARWAADRVGAVPAAAWDGPGLGEWNMRALVGHTSRALLTVEQYLAKPCDSEDVEGAEGYYEAAAAMASADPGAVRQRGVQAGAALGDDPAAAFREIAERVVALLPGQTDEVITTIVGGIRLSSYLPTRTFELVVHGLDICAAAGLAGDPPEVPQRVTLDLAISLAARSGRGPAVVFALTGRAPLPAGFSVV
ncbi:MAG: maleylpyruvate isomerase N-terminal domain-containing protein [Gordonia sp. (in: high G+C Gram-positive bacteria)]